jgi:preprotein translocase subunit SecY
MFEKLRIIFTIPELRQKIFLTMFLLLVYRIGYHVRLPMIRSDLAGTSGSDFGTFLEKVSVLSATDLRTVTIFGLGIMPYISASWFGLAAYRSTSKRRRSWPQEDQ